MQGTTDRRQKETSLFCVLFFCTNKQIVLPLIFNEKNQMALWRVLDYSLTHSFLSPTNLSRHKAVCNLTFVIKICIIILPKRYELPINAKDKRLYGHPTVKPLPIIRNLVENSSKSGDLVLDPFMGSGTTAAACVETDRKFIGFEINKTYWEASRKRLASVYKEN